MLCNRTNLELASITLTDSSGVFTLPSVLPPGACAPLPDLAAGSYNLQFIERGNGQAALCRREVSVVAGEALAVAPDDGARCTL